MQLLPWLALLAGVLPLIFMAIGYWFVTRARRRAEERASRARGTPPAEPNDRPPIAEAGGSRPTRPKPELSATRETELP